MITQHKEEMTSVLYDLCLDVTLSISEITEKFLKIYQNTITACYKPGEVKEYIAGYKNSGLGLTETVDKIYKLLYIDTNKIEQDDNSYCCFMKLSSDLVDVKLKNDVDYKVRYANFMGSFIEPLKHIFIKLF